MKVCLAPLTSVKVIVALSVRPTVPTFPPTLIDCTAGVLSFAPNWDAVKLTVQWLRGLLQPLSVGSATPFRYGTVAAPDVLAVLGAAARG